MQSALSLATGYKLGHVTFSYLLPCSASIFKVIVEPCTCQPPSTVQHLANSWPLWPRQVAPSLALVMSSSQALYFEDAFSMAVTPGNSIGRGANLWIFPGDNETRVSHREIHVLCHHSRDVGSFSTFLVLTTPSHGWRREMSVWVAYALDAACSWLWWVGVANCADHGGSHSAGSEQWPQPRVRLSSCSLFHCFDLLRADSQFDRRTVFQHKNGGL